MNVISIVMALTTVKQDQVMKLNASCKRISILLSGEREMCAQE